MFLDKTAGAADLLRNLWRQAAKAKPLAANLLREGGAAAGRGRDAALSAARRLGENAALAKDRVAAAAKPMVEKALAAAPEIPRQVAGLAPGEKFAPSAMAAVRNLGRAVSRPQIPGLDRAVSAGPVAAPSLASPSTWPRLLSSSRPAQPERAYDRIRQGLAHAIRGSGRAAVGLTLAGTADGVFRGFPNQLSDEMQSAMGSDDPGHRARMRAAVPGLLAAKSLAGLGGDSPVDLAHADAMRAIAVPWIRDAVANSEHNPFARAAKAMRWLNPAGAAFNLFGMPRIAKPLERGELGRLVSDAVRPRAKDLLNPANLRANLDSPWTKLYLNNLPEGQTPRTLASALSPLLAAPRRRTEGRPSALEAVLDVRDAYRGTMPAIQPAKPLSDQLKAPPLPTWLDEGARRRVEEAAGAAAPAAERLEAGAAGASRAYWMAKRLRAVQDARRDAVAGISAALRKANEAMAGVRPAVVPENPAVQLPPAVEFEPVARPGPEPAGLAAEPAALSFGDFQTRRNLLARSLMAKGMPAAAALRKANEALAGVRPR